MPIKVIEGLPVEKQLQEEGIYTIATKRAAKQDIRPLRVIVLNLMPLKQTTELQLLRLLGSTPLQIEVDFMYTASHQSEHTPKSHLQQFYKTFTEVKNEFYDGFIITGAPVEQLDYREVTYMEELNTIMAWAQTNVFSRLYICWGAQYALHYLYNVPKTSLAEKLFGVFEYEIKEENHPFLRGFDEVYQVPQSRHTSIEREKLLNVADLQILTEHSDYGPDIISTIDQRDLFILGHLEYDRDTLKKEYDRDKSRGLPIRVPENYYPNDDSTQVPFYRWRSHGYLLYNNWLNETYQNTYYDLTQLKDEKGRVR